MVRNLLPPQTMDRPSMALILMCHSPYHTLMACPRCQGICLQMQSQASTRREARGCPLKPGSLPAIEGLFKDLPLVDLAESGFCNDLMPPFVLLFPSSPEC
ncbi:hypothetical protein MHYP_G00154870 [Metynnis hypsauchen]